MMHKLIINGYQVGNAEPNLATLHTAAKKKLGVAYTVSTTTDKLTSRRNGSTWSKQ